MGDYETSTWVPEHFPQPVIIDTKFNGRKYMAVLPKKSKTPKRVLPKGFKGFKSSQAEDIDTLRKDAQQRSSKEIRFKDKEAVTIRFLEEPTEWHRFDEHYINGDGGGFVPCIGDGCPLDGDPDSRATRRWLANVVDVGSGEVRLLKMTRALVDTFILKYERSGTKGKEPSLRKRNYTITRLGAGTDTKYDVENEDAGPLEIGGKEVRLSKLKLIDVDAELTERVQRFFGGGYKGKAKAGRGASDEDDDEDFEDEEDDDEDEESDEEDDEEEEEDDEEDDDDDEDDDVEEEEEEKPKRKVVKKKPLPKAKVRRR